jgi:iron complex transport system substrate-binding protein
VTPTRVVCLLAPGTEMVAALGCGERLVGRSHRCDRPAWVRGLPPVTAPASAVDPPPADPGARARALVEHGISIHRVDAVALAALAPDLLVTQPRCEPGAPGPREVEDAVDRVLPSRPRVVALQPDAVAGLWRDVRRVADALGVPERGVQLVSRLRQRMQAIAARCAELAPRPRVACIERLDPLLASGARTRELVAMAGGEDALGQPGEPARPLAWETLVASDPDVVWIAPCGLDLAHARAAMPSLTARPEWRALRAVRAGRVFLGDGSGSFDHPGPRIAETLEILAEALHPAAFRFGHEGAGWERWRD